MFKDKFSAATHSPHGKDGGDHIQERNNKSLHAVWAVVLITLLAFFLRTYQLQDIPPGFNYDEAAHALDSLEILQGTHIVFSVRSGGNPILFMYLIAGFFGLLGAHPFAQRLLVVFMSTATVPAVYLLARTMFRQLGPRRAQFIGALAALGLATSFWHLNHSRMGLEFTPAPFFEVLGFYFLWQGLSSRRYWHFLISGLWLGLALYVYPTARFVPVLLAAFFIYLYFINEPRPHNETGSRSLRHNFLPLLLIGIGTVLIFLPVGIYFIQQPSDFFGRAGDTYFLNPVVSQGRPWARLLEGAIANLGAFGITTDTNALANVPGRSILDPAMAVLFWAGILWSLYRFKNPPHAFCVLWWIVLLIPVFLTPDRFPHFGRLISVAPVVYILIALSIEQLWYRINRLASPRPDLKRLSYALMLIAIILIYSTAGVSAYQDYFFKWASSQNTYEDFYGPTVELAELMNVDTSTQSIYVMPCNTRPPACDYYTIDFCHREGVPFHAIRMNEWEVPQKLTEIVQGKDLVKLIHLKIGKRKFLLEEADPKGMLDLLLESRGELEHVQTFPAYDILHYRLPSTGVDFSTPVDIKATLNTGFDQQLLLQDVAFGDASGPDFSEEQTVPAGGTLWAILRWRSLGDIAENYKSSLRLRDQAGHIISLQDHILQDNWQNQTTRWKPEDGAVSDYYLFSIPATTPPGEYFLDIVVYSPETLRPLPVDDRNRTSPVNLGMIHITVPEALLDTEELEAGQTFNRLLTPGITLAGYDWDLSRSYSPGEKSVLAIYWKVTDTITHDLKWHLELQTPEQNWPLVQPLYPLGPGFLTSDWRPGQFWKRLYDISIPAQVPQGRYPVIGYFIGEQGQTYGETVELGAINIEGGARNFDIPHIQYPTEATFDEKIKLLGYDLSDKQLEKGSTLEIVIHWQALELMDTDYSAFMHLLDGNGQLQAQRDILLTNGAAPTTGWLPNEVISDRAMIPIGSELAAGEYTLTTGIYDASTGQRLPAFNNKGEPVGDNITLETVTVQ